MVNHERERRTVQRVPKGGQRVSVGEHRAPKFNTWVAKRDTEVASGYGRKDDQWLGHPLSDAGRACRKVRSETASLLPLMPSRSGSSARDSHPAPKRGLLVP